MSRNSRVANIFHRIKEFGLPFYVNYYLIGKLKGRRYMQKTLQSYIEVVMQKYGCMDNLTLEESDNPISEPIWVCWWQGIDNMPAIVKVCYESLLRNKGRHEVVLITKNNFNEYIELPEFILDKAKAGIITITHLSDIIRFSLLSRYGGLWVDATYFFTDSLPDEIGAFYTIKSKCIDEFYVSDYRWSGNFIGGNRNNPAFRCVQATLYHYWSHHQMLVDYYFVDYILAVCYERFECFHREVDSVPISNPSCLKMNGLLNDSFNKFILEKLMQDTTVFKLSWKQDVHLYTTVGEMTLFNYISKWS